MESTRKGSAEDGKVKGILKSSDSIKKTNEERCEFLQQAYAQVSTLP